jgi:hypothetical protein
MITYQDYLEVADNDKDRIEWVRQVIDQHKSSDLYRDAVDAKNYFDVQNTTITNYVKTLTTATGRIIEDKYSPNHKVASGFFRKFVIQQNQYLLSNGATWGENDTANKLGKRFDARLQELGEDALIGAVSFGFWNLDHLEVFEVTEFAPVFDEENGKLRMGVRFWQIAPDKPLRATLYEEDGYTEMIWNQRNNIDGQIFKSKRSYKVVKLKTDAEGELANLDQNYEGFPIIPFWGNKQHVSELLAVKDGIDAYDLIKNGFENELDNAQLYWIVKGAGGMDNQDLVQFLDRLLTNRIASVEGDQDISAHEINLPYQARESLLERIEADLHSDYMALNLDEIKSGSVVNAQIKAAYEPMNAKADKYEFQVHEFLDNLLSIVGIDDEATFTRSMITNVSETASVLSQMGEYLSSEYITKKLLTLLGDGDMYDDVIKQMDKESTERTQMENPDEEKETNEEGNTGDDSNPDLL